MDTSLWSNPAEIEKGNLFFQAQDKSQFQFEVLQVGLVKEGLDIIDGETNEEVEGDDADEEEEHHEEEIGCSLEGDRTFWEEDVGVVDLARHHDRHLQHRVLDGGKRNLMGKKRVEAKSEGDNKDEDDGGHS